MPTTVLIFGLGGFALGIVLAIVYFVIIQKNYRSELSNKAQAILKQAEQEEQQIIKQAQLESQKLLQQIQKEEQERKRKIQEWETKNRRQEEEVEKKQRDLLQQQKNLDLHLEKLRDEEQVLHEKQQQADGLLNQISALSPAEAKALLLKKVEDENQADIVNHLEKIVADQQHTADEKIKQILAEAMQRYHGESIAESTVTTLTLPNDEMKGRIIGREGRNINAFEKMSGVDVIVDDSPGVVILSGFDLMRRYIAKIALERLVADGRIHPTRIEEMLEKAREEVATMTHEFGEKVVYELNITGLPTEILKLIGCLRFRTAYGQNVLKHSIEVAKLAGAIAAEVGANVDIAKKAGLLHDIGKAPDQEMEGTHAHISSEICKKFRINAAIIDAIESHHGDVPFTSLEGIIVYTANQLSINRPGAKRDNLEEHIQRMTSLEQAALAFEGVDKAFVMQAGHEIRAIVNPHNIDDLQAYQLARNLAREIEKISDFNGEIKVNVVRETRIIEYAR
ncbi:ribonuclease Y [Candidatus Gracilibacteria bacterium]|nr:ribonuclease Y [Candidatus Gracilibacteria bacterium]